MNMCKQAALMEGDSGQVYDSAIGWKTDLVSLGRKLRYLGRDCCMLKRSKFRCTRSQKNQTIEGIETVMKMPLVPMAMARNESSSRTPRPSDSRQIYCSA